MTISEQLVEWALDMRAGHLPTEVIDTTVLHLIDGIGTAVAARRRAGEHPPVLVGRGLPGAEATILGDRTSISAPGAALANGYLVHALDYDDTHTMALVHITAVSLPVALAVGEAVRATGEEIVAAALIGQEVAARLGAAAPHAFHARGFHATAVCGTISAALVASRLMGLDAAQSVAALGIAGSQAAGSMEFLSTGASTKQLHPGWSSLAGIMAARLAEKGATGPGSVIEGTRGLYALYTDRAPDLNSLTEGLGIRWAITETEIKPYPACHLVHKTLDVLRSVRSEVNVADVAELTVRLPEDSIPIVAAPEQNKRNPRTPYEGKFSVQYTSALMLIDGQVGTASFEPDQLLRPDLLALSNRVTVEARPALGNAADTPGDVTVRFRDGSARDVSPGGPPSDARDALPALRDLVMTKFEANVTDGRADELDLSVLLDLPAMASAAPIFELAARAVEQAAADRSESGVTR